MAETTPFIIRVLIALFERAVGFYASLININAYHQPSVEKAASGVIEIQRQILHHLRENRGKSLRIDQILTNINVTDDAETVLLLYERLARQPGSRCNENGTTGCVVSM